MGEAELHALLRGRQYEIEQDGQSGAVYEIADPEREQNFIRIGDLCEGFFEDVAGGSGQVALQTDDGDDALPADPGCQTGWRGSRAQRLQCVGLGVVD